MTDDQPRRRASDVEAALLHHDMKQVNQTLGEILVELRDHRGDISGLKAWRAWMTGALAALGLCIAVALPVTLYLLAQGAK